MVNLTAWCVLGAGTMGLTTASRAQAQVPAGVDGQKTSDVYSSVPQLRPDDLHALPAVRWERLAPTASAEELGRLESRYTANASVIDAMCARQTTDQEKAQLHRDLGILPPTLLGALKTRGVHIWVAHDNDREIPADFFQSVEPGRVTAEWDRFNHAYFSNQHPRQPSSMGSYAAGPHDSWESIAKRHGASSEAEIATFSDVMAHASAFYNEGRPTNPHQPMKMGQGIVEPDLFYYKGVPMRASEYEKVLTVNGLMKENTDLGDYFPTARVVMVKADTLPDPSPRTGHHRVSIHEVGHAAEDLIEHDAGLGKPHKAAMGALHKQAVAKFQGGDVNALITDYASANSDEHYADGFEAYWTSDRADGVKRDPRWDANSTDLLAQERQLYLLIDGEMKHFE